MSDLISRRAAIKAIENLQDCYNGFSDTYDKACIIGVLEERPTAQPNTPTDTPTDTISRQAAIDSVEKESQIDGAYGYMDTKSIVDLLNDLPSAHTDVPDRNVGDTISRKAAIDEIARWIGYIVEDIILRIETG